MSSECASGGPTGSPSATQVRPWTPYITNPRALVEEQRLVSEVRRGTGDVQRWAAMIAPGGLEIRVGRRVDLVRRVPQQPRATPNSSTARRPADRRRAGTRRLRLQLELPPELVRVLDVLEGEQPQPDRRANAAATAEIHAGENRVSKSAARRSNAGARARARTEAARAASPPRSPLP